MRYHGRDTQQYQQPNTVTENTAQLQIHAIPRPRYTTVPAAEYSYRKYRTITNTCDTTAKIHNRTSSRIQLQKIPHNYKYMRYHGRDTQQYQQPNTVTENTAQLQTHAIVTVLNISNMFLYFYLARATRHSKMASVTLETLRAHVQKVSIERESQKLCSILPFYKTSNFEFLSSFGDLFPNIDDNEILIQKLLKNSELYTDLNYKFQTECQFNQMIHSIGKNVQLSVFHINICSLNANCSKLCQLLAILEINFDVLVLSEISDFNIEFYSKLLSNYKFYKDLPTDSHRGGIGVFIHDSIECKERLDLKIQNTYVNKIENLWFDIIKDKQNFIVGGLYRHLNQFIKISQIQLNQH